MRGVCSASPDVGVSVAAPCSCDTVGPLENIASVPGLFTVRGNTGGKGGGGGALCHDGLQCVLRCERGAGEECGSEVPGEGGVEAVEVVSTVQVQVSGVGCLLHTKRKRWVCTVQVHVIKLSLGTFVLLCVM